LEGKRPKALCPACREALKREASSALSTRHSALSTQHSALSTRHSAPGTQHSAPGTQHSSPSTRKTLCFACYRAEMDRQKAMAAAGRLDTASEARFQYQLPFEPVDRPRLDRLKADRETARVADRATLTGPSVDNRRRAQIEARHALQQIAAGLRSHAVAKADRDKAMASVFHAAELQLPESWIPFVMSR